MKSIIRILAIAVLMLAPGFVSDIVAQPPPPPPPVTGAPIDAFVGLLIIISAFFGVKYLVRK